MSNTLHAQGEIAVDTLERERKIHTDLTRLSRLQYGQPREIHNPAPGRPMTELNHVRFGNTKQAIIIESARTVQAIETNSSEITFQRGHEWYTVLFEQSVDHRGAASPTPEQPNSFFLYGPSEFTVRMNHVVDSVGGGEWAVTDLAEREELLATIQTVTESLSALNMPSAYDNPTGIVAETPAA